MEIIKPAVTGSAIAVQNKQREHRVGWRAFTSGLRFKLIFLIVSISLASTIGSAFFLYSLQRQQLIATAQDAVTTLSNSLEVNLQHAMLTNDRAMLQGIIDAAVVGDSIDTIRVLNSEGVVRGGSVSADIGIRFDRTHPLCQACHTGAGIATNRTSVFSKDGSTGEQHVLLNVNLITNQVECQACHNPEKHILGLFLIEAPMQALNEQLAKGLWHIILLAAGTFMVLTGFMVPVLTRYIVRPVESLSKGVAEITAGNLDYQGPLLTSQDELGELARSFAGMQQKLKTTYAEKEQREKELATINELAFEVTQLLDLQEILDFAVDTAVNKLGLAACMVDLWDEATARYIPHACRGLTQGQIEEINLRRLAGWDITREVAESGKEVIITDTLTDARFQGLWEDLAGRSYVKLPLLSRGLVVGTIGLFTDAGHPVTQNAVELFKTLGSKIGLAIDNARLLATTRRREQEASTLYELGTKVSASLALHEVLDAIAEAARQLLDADVGLVGLVDAANPYIVIKAASGIRAESLKGMRILVRDIPQGSVPMGGQPVHTVIHDPGRSNLQLQDNGPNELGAAFLAVPLQRGESFLGVIEVITWQPRVFLERDSQLLLRLANHVVVSIENAQLYRQLSYMAVLNERDRLAREMHDHLAQSLGYLNVRATITQDLLSEGHIEQAQESLAELKKVAKFVYTDVREAIFNLRTAVSTPTGLIPTLREYLEEYGRHYGVNLQLLLGCEEEIELSPEVASQVLSIVQEALTNVRKHAATNTAWVRCVRQGDQLCVSIEDDGRGFSTAQATNGDRQHIGLQVMRERAESVGGTLELDSQPDRGTRVIVRVPGYIKD